MKELLLSWAEEEEAEEKEGKEAEEEAATAPMDWFQEASVWANGEALPPLTNPTP